MHWRAHAVPVAEIDIVAHADLVAIIDDWRAGQGKQERIEKLDLAPVVFEQGGETAANAKIDPRPRVGGIKGPKIVPFRAGHHGERHLVMVAQKDRPLRSVRDLRRLPHDIGDRMAVLLRQRHVDPRHEGKMKRHMAFVALPEILRCLLRPEIGLGEKHPVRVAGIDRRPDLLDDRVGLGKIFASRAFPLDEIGNGVKPQTIDAHIEPVGHDVEHGFEDAGIVEI